MRATLDFAASEVAGWLDESIAADALAACFSNDVVFGGEGGDVGVGLGLGLLNEVHAAALIEPGGEAACERAAAG